MERFSLINAHECKALPSGRVEVFGSWIQDHYGDLQSARKVADETEAVNSHAITVAVCKPVSFGRLDGPGYATRLA
jgi:hypothetical protein